MELTKLLALAFGPPAANWVISRIWFRYRELRLHKFMFAAWLAMFLPAAILIATGVAQAVDTVIQMEQEEDQPDDETRPATFDDDYRQDQDDEQPAPPAQPPMNSSGFGVTFSGFDWVLGKEKYPLMGSHYDPAEGGINCDADCSTMASGDATFSWAGGKNGVYAAACANRPDLGWVIGNAANGTQGTRFTAGGNIYECRDTGGWIQCYEPGDYDPAIANAHTKGYLLDRPEIVQISYCWVDLYSAPVVPYGHFIADWSFGEVVNAPMTTGKLAFYEAGTKFTAMDNYPHVSALDPTITGDWPGRDFLAACGTTVLNPLPDATVAATGTDLYGNTYIRLHGADGWWVEFMHGDYVGQVGDAVAQGQAIGKTNSHGLSSQCHDHVSVRYPQWELADPAVVFGR